MADEKNKTVENEKETAANEKAAVNDKAGEKAAADKKPEEKKVTKKRDREAEAEAIEAAAESKADMTVEEMIEEEEKPSIRLLPENARFFRSKGNLISLELKREDGTVAEFERVIILRAFPITNPNEFLSVREPDSRKMGRAKEIGMIRYMSDFDEETTRLFLEELDRRYFSPQLIKINSVKDKFGYLYWEAETSAGHVTFIMNNPFSNIRVLEDNRIIINDIDGNVFEIPDPTKLDTASFRKIEIYL